MREGGRGESVGRRDLNSWVFLICRKKSALEHLPFMNSTI